MTLVVHKKVLLAVAFSLLLFEGMHPVCAQDPQDTSGEKPKPAGSSFPSPINPGEQQEQNDQANLAPDTTPLTGVLYPTLGTPEIPHSYWIPGIQWSGSIQSNSYSQTANSGWLINNYIIGNLSLLKAWPGAQLAVNYSAGGFFSSDSTQGSGSYQQLVVSQAFQWHRWQVQLIDEFSYLPQTSLGFGGGTGLGAPGTGGSLGPTIPGIGTGYLPNQSIYSAVGPRYSNASIAQMTYLASRRGSITLSGSYGFLSFVQAGNVDNQSSTATIGYNYLLTKQDTVGAFYRFSSYHFSGQPDAFGDHSFNLAYGRKLTGHLALQVYAGPSFTTSRISVNGQTVTHGVNVGASLAVGIHHGNLNASFSHGITGGSGVLTGSTTDMLTFGAGHTLGRIWSGQVNMSFAHNSPIQGFGPTVSNTYDTWNFGGGVSRPLGRTATMAIAYNATHTKTSTAGCIGTACPSGQTYNYVTINFQWHARPFVLP